jgi:uncharacterized protein
VIELLVIGLLAGVLSGVLGVGGGIIIVPALALLTGETQVQAQATSLVAIIPVAMAGAWRQHHYGNVRVGEAVTIGGLSAAGVLVGVAVAHGLPEQTLRTAFAIMMLLVALRLLRRAARAHAHIGEHRMGARRTASRIVRGTRPRWPARPT